MYRLVVEKYIVPRLGKRPALAVGHKEVTELHHALSAKPIMANHVVDTLSRIYNAAEDRGQIPEASNPCRLVVKYRERKRERFLTEEEFRRLGRVLDESETCKGVSVHAVAAMRLLLLTGCRKGEILNLLWDQVDMAAGELRLPDTKTGPRTITLSPETVKVLSRIPRVLDNPFVIPGRIKGKAMRQSERSLGDRLRSRRTEGHADSRLPPFLRVPGAGARGISSNDWPAARSHAGGNDRALCAPGAGLGAGLWGSGLRTVLRATFSRIIRGRKTRDNRTALAAAEGRREKIPFGPGRRQDPAAVFLRDRPNR